MRKGFTIIELLVAVGVLGLLVAFSGYIFEVSIDSQRTAGANTEIMDKLRVICDQLNADFGEIRTDGYLVLQSRVLDREEYKNEPNLFHDDKLYYFSTGDYQSWFDERYESNTARIYFGHDSNSIYDNDYKGKGRNAYVSEWSLARDVMLIAPGLGDVNDWTGYSFSQIQSFPENGVGSIKEDAISMFNNNNPQRVRIDIAKYANDVRRLMCENVGEIKIEWTYRTPGNNQAIYKDPIDNRIYRVAWFGFDMMCKNGSTDLPGSLKPTINGNGSYSGIEISDDPYRAIWRPNVPQNLWPKALRFTFTIYDSNGVIRGGRRFTHIVVLGN